MNKPVAFFDVDGTIFRSSLLIELVEALIKEGVFPAAARDTYADALVAWQEREGPYEAYVAAIITAFMEHLKGVHYGELADIGRLVVATHQKRVYRYTRDLVARLKTDGYYLVAISQSPKTIVNEFCEGYGFDKVYGRVYELGPQDRFTGAVIDEHIIANKANIARRVFEQQGATAAGSLAVGDTDGDIPLLELVERPICFNPNRTLYEHATRQGWPVVVERKDVIYEL